MKLALVAALTMGLTACSDEEPAESGTATTVTTLPSTTATTTVPKHDFFVSIHLEQEQAAGALGGTECKGQGGYSDVAPGASLTIRDQAGTVLSSATLGTGKVDAGPPSACVFETTLEDVPEASQYQVSVGGGRRGVHTVSHAEARRINFGVFLRLGD